MVKINFFCPHFKHVPSSISHIICNECICAYVIRISHYKKWENRHFLLPSVALKESRLERFVSLPLVWKKCVSCKSAINKARGAQRLFFDKAPSFEAREAHWFLNNRLGRPPVTGAMDYRLGNTSSRTINAVKQYWPQLVLGWETVQVLSKCCC